MKLTICKPDNRLYLDNGRNFDKNLDSFPQNFHALQFDTETGAGEIEWTDKNNETVSSEKKVNTALGCNLSDLIDSVTDPARLLPELSALSEEENKEFALYAVKDQRSALLKESDWMAMPENSGKYTDSWKAYRQKLKDIPQDIESGDITAPVLNETGDLQFDWPDRPVS